MAYLFGGTVCVYRTETLASTRVTIFFILMVHYFKMNSYSKTNRAYRNQYLSIDTEIKKPAESKWEEDQSEPLNSESETTKTDKLCYPENIGFYNFLMFLIYPVFCYEANYPVSQRPASISYLIWKLMYLGLALMTVYIVYTQRWVPIL